MKEKVRFLGLDVHAETIAVAVAEPEGEVRSLGTIPNRAESIRKLIKKRSGRDRGLNRGRGCGEGFKRPAISPHTVHHYGQLAGHRDYSSFFASVASADGQA